MALLPIQVQVITLWASAADRVTATVKEWRDDERGELTGNVIFLVALALVAAVVAGIVVARITSEAEKIQGGG